jgi:hypothetical protein
MRRRYNKGDTGKLRGADFYACRVLKERLWSEDGRLRGRTRLERRQGDEEAGDDES